MQDTNIDSRKVDDFVTLSCTLNLPISNKHGFVPTLYHNKDYLTVYTFNHICFLIVNYETAISYSVTVNPLALVIL